MAKRLLSSRVVHFRCSNQELSKVSSLCKEAGFTRSEYVRGSLLEFANYVSSRVDEGAPLVGKTVMAVCLDESSQKALEFVSSALNKTQSDILRSVLDFGLPSLRQAAAIRKEERRAYRLKRLERLEKLRARLAKSKVVRRV